MAKFLQTHDTDGSVQEILQLPPSFETELENSTSISADTKSIQRVVKDIADGATGAVGTWVAPYACEVLKGSGYKTGSANGDATCSAELRVAAGTAILTYDLNVNDEAGVQVTATDDAIVLVAAGDVLTWQRIKTTADNACKLWFDIIPQ